ncbi:hypothetical protein [Streptomyces sp. AM 3-1-1]|uniref:hypothetical protein n=1 Tax=Streptomyces sp. AM 3-1-1 TaxID=3028711 RepID=UPI0023B952FF|nr:hypothetical protein [Streptomyces sp. AM 3-1-1]WEH30130.1 hypothetical protein P0D76_23970 [Streptomyces sp. AM 3-1-1]
MTPTTIDTNLTFPIAVADTEGLVNLAAMLFAFDMDAPPNSKHRTWIEANLNLVLAVQYARGGEGGG